MHVYDAGSEKLFESINEIQSKGCHTCSQKSENWTENWKLGSIF